MVADWSLIDSPDTNVATLSVSNEGQKSAANREIVANVDDDRQSQTGLDPSINEAEQGCITWHLKLIRVVDSIFHVLKTLTNNLLSLTVKHSRAANTADRLNHGV